MSDSNDDKSPSRRSKRTEVPSEDSKSSNKPSDEPVDSSAKLEDTSKDTYVQSPDIQPSCSYGGARPKINPEKKEDQTTSSVKKDASKDSNVQSSDIQPSCSYGGARPKIYPEKEGDKTRRTSSKKKNALHPLERAVEVLEATVSRQRESFRRRRAEAEKAEEPVSRYLGPGWIDAAAEEKKPRESSVGLQMKILTYEFERRRGERDFNPWTSIEYCHADSSTKQPVHDKPVEGKFEDDLKIESDPPRLYITLPDLKKKSPRPSQKPKDKEKPVEELLPEGVHHDRYYVRSISTYRFLDHPPFIRPEYEHEMNPLLIYDLLDAIFREHGIKDWRRFALAAYETGRFHTEQQLQEAREHMEVLHVTEDEYREMYHMVRRGYVIDEGSSYEFSDLAERIITLLDSMEPITTAMLYMDIWQKWRENEMKKQIERAIKAVKATQCEQSSDSSREDDQETDNSASNRHSGSDIVEDYFSEEKSQLFFYESLREYVTLDLDYPDYYLTLDDKPPSILSSSNMSSIPIPPSPAEIASPSPEGIASPDMVSPASEVDTESKMQICEMVPIEQISVESSSSLPSSRKSLKLSCDKLIDSPRITRLQEMDSLDNTSESVSPLPLDSPNKPELEEGCEIDAERFHIVPHVIVTSIVDNIMNSARERLAAISLSNKDTENVAEQKDKGMESPSQSSEETQSTNSDGKRKGPTDSDDKSGKGMPKKLHMEE